jgi:hypothetical protein
MHILLLDFFVNVLALTYKDFVVANVISAKLFMYFPAFSTPSLRS